MTDNLAIWNAVSKTNPANTKQVNQRGGFTSICAQSQIMDATRQFGPIGQGWGYTAADPIFHDTLVFVQVTLWHGSRDNTFGPVTGGAEWKSDKGRLDSDAPKKATTDAVTKLLSQLGFNADVFLGKFDDNKYVEQAKREFAGGASGGEADAPPCISLDQQTTLIDLCNQTGVLIGDFLKAGNLGDIREIHADKFNIAKAWIMDRAKEKENA